jgi:hypothetical protein
VAEEPAALQLNSHVWHKLCHIRAAEENTDMMMMMMMINNIKITQYLMYFHSVSQ